MLTSLCQSRPMLEQANKVNPTSQNSAGEEYLKKHNYMFISQTIFPRPPVNPSSLKEWPTDSLVVSERSKYFKTCFYIYSTNLKHKINYFTDVHKCSHFYILKNYLCSDQLFSAEDESSELM